MAMVNVNRNNPDQFYRYKMPRLLAKVEGKGNGIKTVISNMTEIAKSLQRPPTYPTKFFGCELGAQTQFDVKRDRYIVNGAHEGEKLQELLDGFIKKFVLCPDCENPETNLVVHAKASSISQRCIACGYNGKLDMRHKLTTFILRNPPDGSEPNKKKGKKGESTGGEEGDCSPDENGDGNEKSAQEMSADIRSGEADILVAPAGGEAAYDDDEVEWGEDTSEEGQRKRMLELTSAAANLAVSTDLEKTPQERADLFFQFIKNKIAECGEKLSPAYRSILAEAERLEIKDKGVLIIAEILLTKDILHDLKVHRYLFLMFTNGNAKAQKYLLGAFEKIVGVEYHDELIGRTATILKMMYDLELVDEEVFIEWGAKVSKKYVSKAVGTEIHSKADLFIKWLKEAEEETSEEEDDDNVELVFTHAEKVGMQDVNKTNGSQQNGRQNEAEDDDADDDVDIDDI